MAASVPAASSYPSSFGSEEDFAGLEESGEESEGGEGDNSSVMVW